MKQENPLQPDLSALPDDATAVNQANAVTDLAALSAKVLDHGLVREHRPVFIFDEKLAEKKSDNALRQAKFREKRTAQGLVMTRIPAEIAAQLKAVGGNWALLLGASSPPPNPGLVSPPGGDLTGVKPATGQEVREVIIEVIKEIRVEVPVEVRIEVPGPVQIVEKIIEKIVEKPVQKLTADQRKIFDLGVKVRKLQGWRGWVLRQIL